MNSAATREPGHYWAIIKEGTAPEIAHFDGDDWFVVGREKAVEPKLVFSERLGPPDAAEAST